MVSAADLKVQMQATDYVYMYSFEMAVICCGLCCRSEGSDASYRLCVYV